VTTALREPPGEEAASPEGPGLEAELPAPEPAADAPQARVHAPLIACAAVLSTLAAAWMTSRLFSEGALALGVSVTGIAIGAGLIYLATRFERSALLLFAVLPVAVVVGAIFATTGEGAGLSLPALAADAVRGGGLLQPPIPFDPGWRAISVVLFAVISSSACLLGMTFRRPKLAAAVPLPIALGAALLQPKGTELTASGVTVVLLVAALAVAYGADLASAGVTSGGFEARRLFRGTALLAGVVIALVAVSQTSFLFPETDKNNVIPPQKPPAPPPEPDQVLFSVQSDNKGPWPVGVLDVYQDNAFLLPSIDPARVRKVKADGVVAPKHGDTFEVSFHVNRLKGQTLIGAPNQVRIGGVGLDLEYDPRTQVVKLAERSVPRDFTYSVEAPVLPQAKVLADSPPADAAIQREFTAMPPPPPGVQQLLTKADLEAKNKFDKLQLVRNALYTKVVAAGGGTPVDVPPEKVDAMLAGAEATPYEISAAEVMLARWAGLPARLGFGFYGGDPAGGGREFHPRHGAAWLETYFEGSGWVPIVGTPPRAKPSLSEENKKKEPEVRPTDELALTVYLPVRRPSLRLLYETIRYYASIVLPIVMALLILAVGYPAVLKAARTRKRLRWASDRGLLARIVVGYAELRDRCTDLNIGDTRHSPLEFVCDVDDDREHRELGWLVTRAIWGDLTRDLRVEDAEAAQEMARSVQRRIDREQSGLNRVLAWTSRASLRDPWTAEIPNAWQPERLRAGLARLSRRARAVPPSGRHRQVASAAAVVLVIAMLLPGCGRAASAPAPATYPQPLMPATIGGYRIERQADIEGSCASNQKALLISECRMYTLRDQADAVQASIQIAVFKSDIDNAKAAVQAGIEGDLGSREAFRTHRYGPVRVRSFQAAEQQFFLWFPPEHNLMQLFSFRKAFGDAEPVVRAVIRHQRTAAASAPEPPVAAPVPTSPSAPTEGSKR
jgi:transglutaminase-like putative cysteine protease